MGLQTVRHFWSTARAQMTWAILDVCLCFSLPRVTQVEDLSVQFSCSVMSNTLKPHGLQYTRLACLSSTLGACSNSCPLSQWCHPTISFSVVPFSSCLQSFPASGLFKWVSSSHQQPKYWSFSISPSKEYSGLITFRIDWFDLLAVQGTLKSLLQHHSSKSIDALALSFP